MNPPHVNKMCQNKPWTDLDLNLGRPEHIKRTCDGSIPSNARIRFMLLENSDRNITVLEKSTSNKMSNKIRNIKDSGRDSLRVGLWDFHL